MVSVEFSGYVKFPEVQTTTKGNTVHRFLINTKQGKKPDGTADYVSFRCKEMTHKGHELGTLPEKDQFVKVKGSLNQYKYTKDGVEKSGMEVFVHELTIAPPRDTANNFPFEGGDSNETPF